uniref:Uncharacterized protein n=1 Tax=Cacopsylla melanoneura TaxID=428564 RepID=A0A8D8QVN7_9HEMI
MRRLSCVNSKLSTEPVPYLSSEYSVDGQSMNVHSIGSLNNYYRCHTYCDSEANHSICDKIKLTCCDKHFNYCDTNTPSLDLPTNIVLDRYRNKLHQTSHSFTCRDGPTLPGPGNRRGLQRTVGPTSSSPTIVTSISFISSVELTNESDCLNHSEQQENVTCSVNPLHVSNSKYVASDVTLPLSSNEGIRTTNSTLSVFAPSFYPSLFCSSNPSSEPAIAPGTSTYLTPLANPFIPGSNQHQLRLNTLPTYHTLTHHSHSPLSLSHPSPPSLSHPSPPLLSLSHPSPPPLPHPPALP